MVQYWSTHYSSSWIVWLIKHSSMLVSKSRAVFDQTSCISWSLSRQHLLPQKVGTSSQDFWVAWDWPSILLSRVSRHRDEVSTRGCGYTKPFLRIRIFLIKFHLLTLYLFTKASRCTLSMISMWHYTQQFHWVGWSWFVSAAQICVVTECKCGKVLAVGGRSF